MIAPCLICGRELREVAPGLSENQPAHGVVAIIRGNYGSTVYDPFDGSHLEVNLCDDCLTVAGDQGRVLAGRRTRPVTLGGFSIGYEALDTPLVEWRKGLPGYDDTCDLNEEDFEEPLPKTIHIDNEALEGARTLIARDGW